MTRTFAFRGRPALLLAAVLLVSLNLRGAIAAVAPVLDEVRDDLSLSAAAGGLVTTLPVLCFALVAPLAAWLGRRMGVERAILLGLVALIVGTVVRVLGGTVVLLVGTTVVGAAMAVGNVLVPVVIKQDFAARAGRVTGLYTAALAAGAAVTAALTAPISAATNWRVGLANWAVLGLVALMLWRRATGGDGRASLPESDDTGPARSVWSHPVAWALALFLCCLSATFYTMTAWLPTILMSGAGLDLEAAGLAASVFQGLGIAGTLVIPTLAARRPSQGWLGLLVSGAWVIMVAGLIVWPSGWLAWSVVGGLAQGAGVSLAFTLLVLRSHDGNAASGLSSMMQLVGYSIGAMGPVAVGWLHDVTGAWTASLVTLLGVAVIMGAAGVVAGCDRTIGQPQLIAAVTRRM